MEYSFGDKQLRDACGSEAQMLREFGKQRARKVAQRLQQIRASDSLSDLRLLAGRCHQLTRDWQGHLALDLDQPYRLIFAPDPWLELPDGGLDWNGVTAVIVVAIVDYH